MLQQITSDNFYEVLNRFSLPELENMIEKYPYFEHAHLLLAKKYQLEKSPKFDEQLQMAVLYTQDRDFLFKVFNEVQVKATEAYIAPQLSPAIEEQMVQKPKAIEEESVTVFEPINTELTKTIIGVEEEIANTPAITESDLNKEVEPENISLHEIEEEYEHEEEYEQEDEFAVSEPHTFDEWLVAFNRPLLPDMLNKTGEVSTNPVKQDEELDKLIMQSVPVNLLHDLVEEETNYSRGLDRFIEEQIQKHRHTEKRETAQETEINPDIITETLAKVYEMQKKYGKAIKSYEVLSLKFPEKNDFFAARINYLKNLM
jgi:hypothetical protein